MRQGLINMIVSIVFRCQSLRKIDPFVESYGGRSGPEKIFKHAFNINDMVVGVFHRAACVSIVSCTLCKQEKSPLYQVIVRLACVFFGD